MRRIVIYVLAAVGVLSLLAGLAVFTLGYILAGGEDAPSIEQSVASPDGHYVALLVTHSGGGAAGWCRQFVVVRPSSTKASAPTLKEADSDPVFSARCSSDFSITWQDTGKLRILVAPQPKGLQQFEWRSHDQSGSVSVTVQTEA